MAILDTPRIVAAALLLSSISIGSQAAADRQGPNPDAPPETSQYAFMIGEWSCTTRFMGPDGTFTDGRASWSAEWILDGWAIQDWWISERPDGDRFHGTNLRSFNRELGHWECRWLPQGTLEWTHFDSEKVDDTMVMNGAGTDARGEYLDRNVFHDIGEASWSWRKERSYDGGDTWITIGHIHAQRAAASETDGS